jgi:hypothetical protein
MSIQTAFRLLSMPTIFGTIGLATTLLAGDIKGWYALFIGFAIGLLAAKLHTPSLLEYWDRVGIPGDQKTLEQQQRWEQETGKAEIKKNLGVVIVGVIGAAILRMYFKDALPIILPAFPAGLATYFLSVGWLIYRKRGKLGPN